MPIIRVEMWKGHSKEKKAALAREFTESMVKVLDIKPEVLYYW